MKALLLRSPYDQVGGYYHFGRMLDKIRLHAAGQLPADYHAALGGGFDGRLCTFLRVQYPALVARVAQGGTDEEILAWCHQQSRLPSADEVEVINEYLRKRGWKDAASPRLLERVQQVAPQMAGQVHTFFDLIEVDEGRAPRLQ
jgi:gluconokinase